MNKNYRGHLLIANPIVADVSLQGTVFFVVDQNKTSITSLCINKPYQNGAMFNSVMLGMGLRSDYYDVPLYFGGIESTNRVFIVHSMDWSGISTVQLADNIGFTTDLSILAAISENQGPEYFRPCAGFTRWPKEQLESDIDQSIWSVTTASIDICFGIEDQQIWDAALMAATKEQVNQWF